MLGLAYAAGLKASDAFCDREATKPLSPKEVRFAVYVDNIAVFALDPDLAAERCRRVVAVIHSNGLRCPGASDPQDTARFHRADL